MNYLSQIKKAIANDKLYDLLVEIKGNTITNTTELYNLLEVVDYWGIDVIKFLNGEIDIEFIKLLSAKKEIDELLETLPVVPEEKPKKRMSKAEQQKIIKFERKKED